MTKDDLEAEEKKWRQLLEDCRSSSLSVISYCEKHNVSKTAIYKWAKRFGLSMKKDGKPKVSFIEVPPLPEDNSLFSEKLLPLEVLVNRGVSIKLEAHWAQVVSLIKELC